MTRMTDLTMGLIKVKIEQPVTSALLNETSVCKTVFCVFLKTLIINNSKILKTSSELIYTSSELICTSTELNSTNSELIIRRTHYLPQTTASR